MTHRAPQVLFSCVMAVYHIATTVAIAARYDLLLGSGLTADAVHYAVAMAVGAAVVCTMQFWLGLRLLQVTYYTPSGSFAPEHAHSNTKNKHKCISGLP